jgi:hypothetical protein
MNNEGAKGQRTKERSKEKGEEKRRAWAVSMRFLLSFIQSSPFLL